MAGNASSLATSIVGYVFAQPEVPNTDFRGKFAWRHVGKDTFSTHRTTFKSEESIDNACVANAEADSHRHSLLSSSCVVANDEASLTASS